MLFAGSTFSGRSSLHMPFGDRRESHCGCKLKTKENRAPKVGKHRSKIIFDQSNTREQPSNTFDEAWIIPWPDIYHCIPTGMTTDLTYSLARRPFRRFSKRRETLTCPLYHGTSWTSKFWASSFAHNGYCITTKPIKFSTLPYDGNKFNNTLFDGYLISDDSVYRHSSKWIKSQCTEIRLVITFHCVVKRVFYLCNAVFVVGNNGFSFSPAKSRATWKDLHCHIWDKRSIELQELLKEVVSKQQDVKEPMSLCEHIHGARLYHQSCVHCVEILNFKDYLLHLVCN